MKKILLGKDAKSFYSLLSNVDWKSKNLDPSVKGGIFESEIPNVYVAFDNTNSTETFVEDFDDIIEAAKYVSGNEAKTIYGTII